MPTSAPLTTELLHSHMAGKVAPRGVYLMDPGSDKVQLSAFDLDDHDATMAWDDVVDVARAIIAEAGQHYLSAWVVRSGGGRGVHIGFRWDEPQSALWVRDLMITILSAVGYSDGDGGLANSEIEVFPKQDSVHGHGHGSLIALPFARESKPLNGSLEDAPIPLMWVSSRPVAPAPEPTDSLKVEGIEDAYAGAVTDALRHVDADSRDSWLRVGLALKRDLPEHGLEIWDAWSKRSVKYPGKEALEGLWNRFRERRDGKVVTLGYIFHWARAGGWNGELPGRGHIIRIAAGEIERIVDESEDALLDSDHCLYSQGGRIVHVILEKVKTSCGEVTDHHLHAARAAHLNEKFSSSARYLERNKNNKWVRVNPPSFVATTYLARGRWRLPPILGVVTAPTLRPDGSVLDRPGYDEDTGLFYDPMGVVFEPVPRKPSRADALRAIGILKHPIRLFPFVEEMDRSVALSAVITTVIRRAMPVVPMHGFNAPVAGSGKSKLVNWATAVGTGHEAPVTGQRSGKFGVEELDKQLSTSMLCGSAAVSLDNLIEPLNSALLCQCLTEPMVTIRHFGALDESKVANGTMFFSTGNNLTLVGDLTRRSIIGVLDPRVERPELRVFEEDPVAMAKEHRGRYVNAVLTAVLAYLNRAPDDPFRPAAPLGSYEGWSRMVRDTLMWLGEVDPVRTMDRIREDDPVRSGIEALMVEWELVIGLDKEVTAAALVKRANERRYGDEELVNEDLHQALMNVASKNQAIDAIRLGKYLKKNSKRVVNERRIMPSEQKASGSKTQWYLTAVRSDAVVSDGGQTGLFG
jgi:putative DNA primase/helicase